MIVKFVIDANTDVLVRTGSPENPVALDENCPWILFITEKRIVFPKEFLRWIGTSREIGYTDFNVVYVFALPPNTRNIRQMLVYKTAVSVGR